MKILLLLAIVLSCKACQREEPRTDPLPRLYPILVNITDPIVVFAVNGINKLFQSRGDPRQRVPEYVWDGKKQEGPVNIYTVLIEVAGGDSNEKCTVVILSQPGMSDPDKIDGIPHCVPQLSATSEKTETVISPILVRFVEREYNAESKNTYYRKIAFVGKITSEYAYGGIDRLYDIKFADTNCTMSAVRSNPSLLESCKIVTVPEQTETCYSTVYPNFDTYVRCTALTGKCPEYKVRISIFWPSSVSFKNKLYCDVSSLGLKIVVCEHIGIDV